MRPRAATDGRGQRTRPRAWYNSGRGESFLRWVLAPIAIVVLAVILAAVQVFRPVPGPSIRPVVSQVVQVPGTAPALPWPKRGQAAVAVAGVGTMGHFGPDQPQPIASLAKMMTALLTLQEHPLQPGSDGPTLVVQPADVQLYRKELAGGQSVVKVAAGEKLTERQLLEGLLLPSGNNFAVLLARLDAGGLTAFVSRMNAEAKKLGLTQTHYADASGVDPATVSTAVDQLKLAEMAMKIPAFRNIVAMAQVVLPVAGLSYNVNYFLGHSGIIGVKTGSTSRAGGCYVSAAYRKVGGQRVLVIASVLGQGGVQPLMSALHAGENLLNAAGRDLTMVQVLRLHQAVARVSVPWQAAQSLDAPQAASFVGWPGMTGTVRLISSRLKPPVAAGTTVATLAVTVGTKRTAMPLKLKTAIKHPSLLWRLTRKPL